MSPLESGGLFDRPLRLLDLRADFQQSLFHSLQAFALFLGPSILHERVGKQLILIQSEIQRDHSGVLDRIFSFHDRAQLVGVLGLREIEELEDRRRADIGRYE